MGHIMFFLSVVAACLLWSATCVAWGARTERPWPRRLLVAIAVILPPLGLLPLVCLTGLIAFAGLPTNWFAPTLTAFLSAVVGGLWIRVAGLSRDITGTRFVAAAWPVIGLAAMFVMAKAVAWGTLLFIDNAVVAQGRSLRVEAAQIVQTSLPPAPAADDDAAPLYLRAIAAIEADQVFADQKSPLLNPLTMDLTQPEVASLLARHDTTLDLLRRAADKPGCRFVRDWSRPSIDTLLGETQSLRQAARLLALAIRNEAAAGNVAAAVRDIVRLHRIGMHAAAEPFLVCGVIGQAIDTLAVETLVSTLPGLRQRDLPLLDEVAVADLVARAPTYHRHFFGDEAVGLATLADQIGNGPVSSLDMLGPLYGSEPISPLLGFPLSLLYRCFLLPDDIEEYRGIMRRYQRLFGEIEGPHGRPLPSINSRLHTIEQEVAQQRMGIFSRLMIPGLSGILRSQARAEAIHRAAEVLVAATRARLASGALPGSAEALVPGFLAAMPRDPFTDDRTLVSRQTDDAWLVYSVGPDGEDDGGPPEAGVAPAEGNDDVGLRLRRSVADSAGLP